MATTRADEINEAMLQEMAANNISDTPQHRVWFLEGLRDAWEEDEDSSIEKSLYMLALSGLIFVNKAKAMVS